MATSAIAASFSTSSCSTDGPQVDICATISIASSEGVSAGGASPLGLPSADCAAQARG